MNVMFKFAFLLVPVLTAPAIMGSESKTTIPVKVADDQVADAPYRFNGVVRTKKARGSGFCAWNKRTFFSAAHVVFDSEEGEWLAPPTWYPQAHSIKLNQKSAIRSRGYIRWAEYQDFASEKLLNDPNQAFGKDVIVGFAFRDLMSGSPAKLNLDGASDLKKATTSLMTGYPAKVAYTNQKIGGYFMYQTGPSKNAYEPFEGDAMETTLISSGPGNSGGPIWTKDSTYGWTAAGVVVGGRPSESVVYAFSSNTNTLLKSVGPLVDEDGPQSEDSSSVSSSSRFFSDNRSRRLPDGEHKWTDVPLNVSGFGKEATVKKVRVAVEVDTTHRGDLFIVLTAPGGYEAIIHNEQGAGAKDLVIDYVNVGKKFEDILAEGKWVMRFQDRLKGDICTVRSVVLEVEAELPASSGTDP